MATFIGLPKAALRFIVRGMHDELDRYVAGKKREREEHQAAVGKHQAAVGQLDRLIAALEEAAKLRPGNAAVGTADERQVGNGYVRKPEGAISGRWRSVLRAMAVNGNEYPVEEIWRLAADAGIGANARSVRDRMRLYVQRGFVVASDDGYYSVTEAAKERFGLRD
jgi:hypothetical protein